MLYSNSNYYQLISGRHILIMSKAVSLINEVPKAAVHIKHKYRSLSKLQVYYVKVL